jgi:hypothetical protein
MPSLSPSAFVRNALRRGLGDSCRGLLILSPLKVPLSLYNKVIQADKERGKKNKIFKKHLWANFGWGQNLPSNFKVVGGKHYSKVSMPIFFLILFTA